jgi:hypothetical protein
MGQFEILYGYDSTGGYISDVNIDLVSAVFKYEVEAWEDAYGQPSAP